ncbi:metallophosphoesterase [Streptomyces sp. NP160]|uniref:metallophosphoesterase family protein n=1 Tax=Streptomyces sp. NP160 TaxID=2586637 RepID=UPI00111A7E16|nr:metallophosphoesterase [Streptomyces sp. NP160]TNM61152.1 metallophosphoesterase [Streptomyces sp. NP160]
MATRLLLLADTHVPVRARALPAQVLAAVDEADLVVHAGDWVGEAVLDELQARCAAAGARLLGVAGNNDGPGLRARLPEVARDDVEGLRLAVVHETGPAGGRERRCAAAFPDVDVLVFGHSHIPWDSTALRPGGGSLRLLNPGSPTDRRRQPACTYLTALAADGALHDVVLHALPLRGGRPPG